MGEKRPHYEIEFCDAGCGTKFGIDKKTNKRNFQVHHLIPIDLFGPDHILNYAFLCIDCHKKINPDGSQNRSEPKKVIDNLKLNGIIRKDYYFKLIDKNLLKSVHVDFLYLDVVSSGREIDIASNVAVKLNKPVLVGIHIKKNKLLPSNETITEVLNKYRSNNWLGVITACVSPKIAEECTYEIKKIDIPFGFKANLWKVEEPTPVQTFNKAKPDEIGTNPNVTLGKRDNNSAKKFYDFSKRLVEQGDNNSRWMLRNNTRGY